MDRLFLDANVLFSAAWPEDSGLLRFWNLPGVEFVSSAYAVDEARRNLMEEIARRRLEALLERTTIVAEGPLAEFPPNLALATKDRSILAAAIHARASHLVTGDRRDFGSLFGRRIRGVLILRPADYLQRRPR